MAGGAGNGLQVAFGVGQPLRVGGGDVLVAGSALALHVLAQRSRLDAVGGMAVLAFQRLVAGAPVHAGDERLGDALVALLANDRLGAARGLLLGRAGGVRVVAVRAQRRLLAAAAHQRRVHAVLVQ